MNSKSHTKCRGKTSKRDRVCGKKKRHSCKQHAELARIKTQETTGTLGLVSYRCPYCKSWHVGHASHRVQKRLRAQQMWAAIDRARSRDRKTSSTAEVPR